MEGKRRRNSYIILRKRLYQFLVFDYIFKMVKINDGVVIKFI